MLMLTDLSFGPPLFFVFFYFSFAAVRNGQMFYVRPACYLGGATHYARTPINKSALLTRNSCLLCVVRSNEMFGVRFRVAACRLNWAVEVYEDAFFFIRTGTNKKTAVAL